MFIYASLSLIHSGHFYSASSSPLLLRGAPIFIHLYMIREID